MLLGSESEWLAGTAWGLLLLYQGPTAIPAPASASTSLPQLAAAPVQSLSAAATAGLTNWPPVDDDAELLPGLGDVSCRCARNSSRSVGWGPGRLPDKAVKSRDTWPVFCGRLMMAQLGWSCCCSCRGSSRNICNGGKRAVEGRAPSGQLTSPKSCPWMFPVCALGCT
jgi:hypothetical protein